MFIYENTFEDTPQNRLELAKYGVAVHQFDNRPGVAVFIGEEENLKQMVIGMYSQSGLPLYEATEEGLRCWPDRTMAQEVLELVNLL